MDVRKELLLELAKSKSDLELLRSTNPDLEKELKEKIRLLERELALSDMK